MFESAEIGHKIGKAAYEKEAPALREALLDAQYNLLESAEFSVVILIAGVDGAGKGDTLNLINEWMDPRHIRTRAMGEATDEERQRPAMWRFWRALPAKGKIGVFTGCWYSDPIQGRVAGKIKNAELDQCMEQNVRFEKMLTDENVVVLKFWLHLSKAQQKARFKALEKNPATRWRVGEGDWEHHKRYDKLTRVAERALRQTSTAVAPWFIVEGSDARYRGLTVGRMILEAIRKRLALKDAKSRRIHAPPLLPAIDQLNLLRTLDLSLKLDKRSYERELAKYQGRLNMLTRDPRFSRVSVVLVFEGNDAAGKGGSIRRITRALDARQYQVVPIAAPTEEERAQPYLWRFWRHVPAPGAIVIFDRSWYGRVLVERVENLAAPPEWMRAYGEIDDFEEQLVRSNTVVLKFWLAIGKDEQKKRFEERQKTGYKRYKITEEDWRNRDKWDAYELAVCDMVDRTSTEIAPWTLVEANDKYYARVKVLKTLCEHLQQALERF